MARDEMTPTGQIWTTPSPLVSHASAASRPTVPWPSRSTAWSTRSLPSDPNDRAHVRDSVLGRRSGSLCPMPLEIREASTADQQALAALRWQWHVERHGDEDSDLGAFERGFARWWSGQDGRFRAVVARDESGPIGMGFLAVVNRYRVPVNWIVIMGTSSRCMSRRRIAAVELALRSFGCCWFSHARQGAVESRFIPVAEQSPSTSAPGSSTSSNS